MPEFKPNRRRSMTDQQLYEEYHGIKKSDKAAKKDSTAKKSVNAGAPSVKKPASENQRKSTQKPVSSKKRPVSNPDASRAASSRTRYASRKKRGRFTLYYVFCGILIAAVLSVLSVTVLFNISAFEVVGETSFSDEEIIEACGIKKGSNLLRINIEKAEESIVSQLVYIDSAKITRGFPNRLIITVEEAEPVAAFSYLGNYYVISARGRLLEISGSALSCPTVTGFAPSADSPIGAQLEDDEEGRVSIALEIVTVMKEQGLDSSCVIDLSDSMNITLLYDGRIEMELGTSSSLEDKFYHASMLLESEIAETEKCTLILTNPDRVVKRPVYDTEIDDESNTAEEDEEEAAEDEPEEEQEEEQE